MRTRKGRGIVGLLAVVGLGAVGAMPAQAAAPDGYGPWADYVLYQHQGLRADGTAVLPSRSDPKSALGVAENDNSDGSFFSLGFGGQIILGFKNKIVNGTGADVDIKLVEATFEPYPAELVDVYVLKVEKCHRLSWVKIAGNVNKDATLPMPSPVPSTHVVKLVDVSDKSLFTGPNLNADGYDVDGVSSLHAAAPGHNDDDD